ncbi:alpha/beta fold hydrolase [Pseudomonas aeruginosa]
MPAARRCTSAWPRCAGYHAAAGRRSRPAPGRAGRRMSGALLVSGFFLRRSAWSVEGAGWRSCDHLRDAPGCDLAHWLDQAAATLAGEERVILCGHSFGGYLAQCLAARLGERAAHLYLFSALVSEGGGALESYQDSGQDNLLGLCRLDPLGGRVRLEDRAGFLELLGAEVPTSASEPAQLLIDSPRQTRPACPVTYVVAAADRLSPPSLQRSFARRLDARVREYPGGHLAALADPRFLRALIESNN